MKGSPVVDYEGVSLSPVDLLADGTAKKDGDCVHRGVLAAWVAHAERIEAYPYAAFTVGFQHLAIELLLR